MCIDASIVKWIKEPGGLLAQFKADATLKSQISAARTLLLTAFAITTVLGNNIIICLHS